MLHVVHALTRNGSARRSARQHATQRIYTEIGTGQPLCVHRGVQTTRECQANAHTEHVAAKVDGSCHAMRRTMAGDSDDHNALKLSRLRCSVGTGGASDDREMSLRSSGGANCEKEFSLNIAGGSVGSLAPAHDSRIAFDDGVKTAESARALKNDVFERARGGASAAAGAAPPSLTSNENDTFWRFAVGIGG